MVMVESNSKASLSTRLFSFGALVIPTAVSIFLVLSRSKAYSDPLLDFVRNQRASVQILVQLFAHGLALLQLQAFRCLIDFQTRLHLSREYVTLDRLALRTALSRQYLDSSLSARSSVLVAAALAVFAVPGALWAGALTPQLTSDMIIISGTIQVPQWSASTKPKWDFQYSYSGEPDSGDRILKNTVSNGTLIRTKDGIFTNSPVPDLQGLLLTSASTATPGTPGQNRTHARLDNSQWTFIGRSYGVGSSPNLANASVSDLNNHPSYRYFETGYRTHVECIKNHSMDLAFKWDRSETIGRIGHFAIYSLEGSLPNFRTGFRDNYLVTAFDQTKYNTLLGWMAYPSEDGSSNIVSFATGIIEYTDFDQTQCEITFEPTMFEVQVNTTSRSIQVEPQPGMPASDPEPGGRLIFNTMASLNLLGRMSNSLYTSVAGDAFQTNLNSTRQRLNISTDDSDSVLESTADSVTAVLDDILVAYGAAQMAITRDTTDGNLTVFAQGVRIGEDVYIYITLAGQGLLLAAVLFESFRTGLWKGMSSFDHTNIKCAMVAASACGTALSEAMAGFVKEQGGGTKVWHGEPRSEAFERIGVIYRPGDDREGSGYNVASVDDVQREKWNVPTTQRTTPEPGLGGIWRGRANGQYHAVATDS